MAYTIYKWEQLKDAFKGSVILGNGASINVTAQLNYKSLFEFAKTQGLTQSSIDLFQKFQTEDFEKILYYLIISKEINETHSINSDSLVETYQNISEALVKTVRLVHPEYNNVKQTVNKYNNFFLNFKFIFSLNYDLLVYWSVCEINKSHGPSRVKDCFIHKFPDTGSCLGQTFESEWSFLKNPYPGLSDASLVFYPHGNLCLSIYVKHDLNRELKHIAQDGAQLLDVIMDGWVKKEHLPLYVSEGSSALKKNRILSSPYLTNVYRNGFENVGGNLTFFGFGFGEQDIHILERLQELGTHKNIESVAVSVYTPQGEWENNVFCSKVTKKLSKYLNSPTIYFYDSDSIF